MRDKSADGRLRQVYSRRTFYLGKDILYYLTKDRTFPQFLIANHKYKVISLHNVGVTLERDNKGSAISLSLPSTSSLLLKAEDTNKLSLWYSKIQYSATNTKANVNIELLERALRETEHEIARADRKEIMSLFTGIEVLLSTEERRTALFENLSCYKEEYKYLGELYNTLQAFETMRKLGKFNDAVLCAKSVYQMVAGFNLEDEFAPYSGELEDKVRQMMSSLVNPRVTKEMQEKFSEVQINGSAHIKSLELFTELEQNLLRRIDEGRKEMSADKKAMAVNDMKLLEIPITHYKRSCYWTAPNLLKETEATNLSISRSTARKLQRYNTGNESALQPFNLNTHQNNSDILQHSKGHLTYRGNSEVFDL